MRQEFCVSGQTLWQWRTAARQQAITANISAEEVDWLLQDLAGLDRLSLRLETFKDRAEILLCLPLSELTTLWEHRIQDRVPVQYLTGVAPWREFLLNVSPAVLIPRPETECLIDLAIAAATPPPDSPLPTSLLTHGHWADLGTGSGAIAIGLATAFPAAMVHAVDYSAAALAIAQSNAQKLNLADRIRFYEGSWLQPLAHLKGKLSGMVANPPYIPSQMVPDLQPEVARHEPHLALDGGMDGFDCLRHLVAAAPDYLQPGGVWLVETMTGQAIAVAALLQQQGSYHQIQIYPDLAGIDRFVLAYRH
ncbi:peptide chain release factor N(5)-glutamine methyltransferase [Stenomitos frigidus ULC18]|uniref:Release factor glutamine methyltransferase n=1 Tax=Stenomitos frigidus ULC18 TaxID=2107698 RepID=A0A2T1DX66_9CYAN|nr:peptide chain release factor N(5)-glutamine methyltransferase [Stenomitos frigidus ULC18]